MALTKTQLIGGLFQDSEGNVLANGYLIFELSQDEKVSDSNTEICSGIRTRINLNSSGSISISPTLQYIWGNDDLLPINSFYRVWGYTSEGQLAWGPNAQQVISGATFDVGTWVPNVLTNWNPPLTATTLETNGVVNADQTLLNLKNGANVAITDDGLGGVTIAATVPGGITLKTNGTSNGSQTILNLAQGTNVTLVDNGSGTVTFNSSGKYIPTPDYRLSSRWLPGVDSATATNIVVTGDTIVSRQSWNSGAGSKTVTTATSTTNPYFQGGNNWAAGPGSITSCFFAFGEKRTWSGRNIRYAAKATPVGSTANNLFWLGMAGVANNTNAITFVFSTAPTTIPLIGFYTTVGGNWFCNVGDGSAITSVDSGIAGTVNVPHLFEFTVNAGTNVVFKIDGNVVATISTHLPSAALAHIFSAAPSASTAAGLQIPYIYSEVDTIN